MKKLSRRALFPLAAAGAAVVSGAEGATIDPYGQPGLLIRIARYGPSWCVLTPDFESMHNHWRPGMCVPTKWVPINEYLDLIDETYSMDS